MKKAAIFITLIITLFLAHTANAQQKAVTKIASVKQGAKTVAITITSSKPFIFGNNRYMLYIGDKDFTMYHQPHDDAKNQLTFDVPAESYANLKDGEDVYLTYGSVFHSGSDRPAIAKTNKRCWSLGKFSKNMTKEKATK